MQFYAPLVVYEEQGLNLSYVTLNRLPRGEEEIEGLRTSLREKHNLLDVIPLGFFPLGEE